MNPCCWRARRFGAPFWTTFFLLRMRDDKPVDNLKHASQIRCGIARDRAGGWEVEMVGGQEDGDNVMVPRAILGRFGRETATLCHRR